MAAPCFDRGGCFHMRMHGPASQGDLSERRRDALSESCWPEVSSAGSDLWHGCLLQGAGPPNCGTVSRPCKARKAGMWTRSRAAWCSRCSRCTSGASTYLAPDEDFKAYASGGAILGNTLSFHCKVMRDIYETNPVHHFNRAGAPQLQPWSIQ